jgi:putative ABC transport system permease protein
VRLVAAVAALLRRLRAEREVAILLFVLIGLTSLSVAAGPRLFNRVADEGIRYEAERGTAIQRNLQFTVAGTVSARQNDPFGRVLDRGDSLRTRLPDSLQRLVGEARFVVDAPRFGLADPPRFSTFVTLRQQDGIEEHIDLTAGRWPAPVEPDPEADPPAPPAFEIVLSEAALATTGVSLGDRLAVNVDPNDPLLRNLFPRPSTAVELLVVGKFVVRDVLAPYWYDDRGLADAAIGGTDDAPIAFATALFAPDAYVDTLALGLPMRYRWRFFVDPARIDAGAIDVLAADLRRVEAANTTTGALRPGSTQFRSGLLDIVERYLDQRASSEAALSVAALGPLTVAGGAMGLIGVLIVRRRRGGLALARGRGASAGQLLATQLWEGLLIAVPAATLGLVAATTVVPARASELSSMGALLVAFGATALLLAATWPVARQARRDLERDDPPVFRLAPRRLMFETLIITLSLAAAWLLRERGVAGSGQAATDTGFDPFLAAAPVLVGLSVGLLTLRLYPAPVRALGWVSARRRNLVPALGLRNLGRRPTTGYLPVLILMLTVAIGTFSSIVGASIERSQTDVSWRDVGADYRIESSGPAALDEDLDAAAVPGVGAVAAGLVAIDVPLSTGPGQRFTILLEAVDPVAYDAVLAGSPVELRMSPPFADAPVGPEAGTAAAPIPLVLSRRLPAGNERIPDGTLVEMTIRGQEMTFELIGVRDGFPGIPASEPFAIAPFASIEAAWRGEALQPNLLLVRAPESSNAAIRAAASGLADPPALISRYDRFAEMHDAPLVSAVTGGFVVALLLALAYAALAIVAVAILHAQQRSREVAFLRTLGTSNGQIAGLTIVEQGIPVILALTVGVGLGFGLAWLLAPGIDLAAFSSPGATVALVVDWLSVAGVGLLVVGVVAAAVGGSALVARRADLGHALRIGEQ